MRKIINKNIMDFCDVLFFKLPLEIVTVSSFDSCLNGRLAGDYLNLYQKGSIIIKAWLI